MSIVMLTITLTLYFSFSILTAIGDYMPVKLRLKYRARLSGKEGFHVSSTIRKHGIDIDESPAVGGTDKGPNPLELLLTALGSCQIILIKMYAKKFKVKVNSIETNVEGEIDVRGFQNVPGVRSGFQNIKVYSKLDAEGDAQNIDALIKTAEKCCPIFDTVSHGVPVESQVDIA